mmetsp:Transcript_2555/g.2476  ORF Transcript_2555/g.2476 Transcript_2555/m.2476 type:complete len:438 (-) Transcript_2555:567-1880(-)
MVEGQVGVAVGRLRVVGAQEPFLQDQRLRLELNGLKEISKLELDACEFRDAGGDIFVHGSLDREHSVDALAVEFEGFFEDVFFEALFGAVEEGPDVAVLDVEVFEDGVHLHHIRQAEGEVPVGHFLQDHVLGALLLAGQLQVEPGLQSLEPAVVVQDVLLLLRGHQLHPQLQTDVPQQTQLVVPTLQTHQLLLLLRQLKSVAGFDDGFDLGVELGRLEAEADGDLHLHQALGDCLLEEQVAHPEARLLQLLRKQVITLRRLNGFRVLGRALFIVAGFAFFLFLFFLELLLFLLGEAAIVGSVLFFLLHERLHLLDQALDGLIHEFYLALVEEVEAGEGRQQEVQEVAHHRRQVRVRRQPHLLPQDVLEPSEHHLPLQHHLYVIQILLFHASGGLAQVAHVDAVLVEGLLQTLGVGGSPLHVGKRLQQLLDGLLLQER